MLPVGFPATVIVIQHIAADFAPGLARWLQGHTALPVRLANEGDDFKPGEVLLAGTNDHLMLHRTAGWHIPPVLWIILTVLR